MAEEHKHPEKKEDQKHDHKEHEQKKKIESKPLPVDKEKAAEMEKSQSETKAEVKAESAPETKDKKKVEQKPKVKKEEAIAKGVSVPMSKKHAMYVCSFIKGKKIDQAIADLEKVVKLKIAVPFKGEIPHRKGNIERGRYPVSASKYFINILKGLKGNAIANGLELEDTKIYFGSASWAARPSRRGGMKGKRTNVTLKAKEFPQKVQSKTKENKK